MRSNRDIVSHENPKGVSGAKLTVIDQQGSATRTKENLLTRFLRWLYPDQRKTRRHTYPPIVSYLGAVHATSSYQVADISASGFFMVTVDRWLPGTEMPVTLQRTDRQSGDSNVSITLLSTVVRTGKDGVGFAFVQSQSAESKGGRTHSQGDAQKHLEKFLEGLDLSEFTELGRAS